MGEIEEIGFSAWRATSPLEERLERLVRALTYVDGWEFRLARSFLSSGSESILVITWEVDDLEVPGQRTLLSGTVRFRADAGDIALRMFVFDVWSTIQLLEGHERLEQLRLDGKPIWDPHPPGSRGANLIGQPDLRAPLPFEEVPA